ncbi:hypothetical protein C7455_102172 [Roseicyclus mahoneyensis]|uniref:Uncharacterized protein n=1 Tax=Roseicyclus mahoneyensis TaxID=164332 RepID=A0A316GKN8_9RHOB|nr:hypothetical protein C7455_102172 [Roseicyclus mahoneyensis]
MSDQASNVVTEDGLRSLLACDHLIEVACMERAGTRHTS